MCVCVCVIFCQLDLPAALHRHQAPLRFHEQHHSKRCEHLEIAENSQTHTFTHSHTHTHILTGIPCVMKHPFLNSSKIHKRLYLLFGEYNSEYKWQSHRWHPHYLSKRLLNYVALLNGLFWHSCLKLFSFIFILRHKNSFPTQCLLN